VLVVNLFRHLFGIRNVEAFPSRKLDVIKPVSINLALLETFSLNARLRTLVVLTIPCSNLKGYREFLGLSNASKLFVVRQLYLLAIGVSSGWP
jgi:hypothetical protein